jgi:hypothetical protein
VKAQGRRPRGSLASVQKAIFAVIAYNWEVIDDPELDHEVKHRATNSQTQAVLAWAKLEELFTLEKEMQAFEHLTHGNGHHP